MAFKHKLKPLFPYRKMQLSFSAKSHLSARVVPESIFFRQAAQRRRKCLLACATAAFFCLITLFICIIAVRVCKQLAASNSSRLTQSTDKFSLVSLREKASDLLVCHYAFFWHTHSKRHKGAVNVFLPTLSQPFSAW